MVSIILLLLALQLSYGSRTNNLRHLCPSQHSRNTYKVSCDGSSSHFEKEELFLDRGSTTGITDIELRYFQNIKIISETQSDFDHVNKFSIKNCKNVTFHFKSILKLNQLEVKSIDEFTIEAENYSYKINSKSMMLLDIGKFNLGYNNDADIKVNELILKNVKDMDLGGKSKLSGDKLTVSLSNIDLTENATLFLEFTSINMDKSTRFYIQNNSKLTLSMMNLLIEESYLYMEGQVILKDNLLAGNRKIIKFLHNSIYNLKKNRLLIDGDSSDFDFIDNGVYSSDVGDVMELLGKTENAKITNNQFGCDRCSNANKLLLVDYPKYIGDQNFCYLTCNLTMNKYRELLELGSICRNGESQMNDERLCSAARESSKYVPDFFWVILVAGTVFSILFLIMILYFYCRRHSPRFAAIPTQRSETNQNVEQSVKAFSNDTYEQVDLNSGGTGIYEIVDSPRDNR